MPRPRQTSAHRQRRQAEESRQDAEAEISRLFAQRFGSQGDRLLPLLRSEFGGLDQLPPGAIERVINLWADAVAATPSQAPHTRLVAVYLDLLRRGGTDLRDQMARAAGVDPSNRRDMARFLRRIGPAVFRIPQTQALAFYDAHAGRLITRVDDTTRRAIVAIVRNALTNGTPYTAVEGALKERFEALRQYQPQKHIRTRARLIAVTETGQAYERGKQSTVHRAEARRECGSKKAGSPWGMIGFPWTAGETRTRDGYRKRTVSPAGLCGRWTIRLDGVFPPVGVARLPRRVG